MKTIGLCMIVKNEAHVILRCLDSVRPLLDYVLIEDTGSTDGTQAVIRDWLEGVGLPGRVYDEPWRNFASNRTHALHELRQVRAVDYALIIDADDALVIEDGFDIQAFKSGMQHDLYDVQIVNGNVRYHRPQICSNKLAFTYKSILHEYLEGPEGRCTRAAVQGFHIETGRGGARSQNPRKYEQDAELLEQALLTETDPFLVSRYKFYLAQSYRDSGQQEQALQAYLQRAELGFWTEEVFESLYNAGKLKEALGYPDVEIIGTYLKAVEYSPARNEPLHALVKYCHRNGKYSLGYMIGKQAITKPMPPDGLFVEKWIYEYGMLDEFAVAAYWAGEYRDSLDACLKLLADGRIPGHEHARVQANADFAREKLRLAPQSATLQPIQAAARASQPDSLSVDDHAPTPPLTQRPMATVVVVQPANYVHWQAYWELAQTVFHACTRLGYETTLTPSVAAMKGLTIVIGAHVMSPEQAAALPDATIIYNSEHADSAWIECEGGFYSRLLRRCEVWDYSQDNARRLSALLRKEVRFVKLGYVSQLTRIEPGQSHDIDVLFYGSANARRQTILDGLRGAGLAVHHAFGVYGRERDGLIARAKVVLNMHQYEPGAFEVIRVSYLLANRKAVVTEANPGETIDDDLAGSMIAAPYDELVEACKSLVADDARRHRLEEAGFAAFSARDETTILESAIGCRTAQVGKRLMVEPFHGIPYLDFLRILAVELKPRTYLEIGTNHGDSLECFECDAICIDPQFQINQASTKKRRKTFYFQMTSDEFFQQSELNSFVRDGIDVAFLDGMHRFEFLLRDFMNTERLSRPRSAILLHDCLPLNLRMAERTFRVDETEDITTRLAWAGDVWRVLRILKKYRDDLRIFVLDCPPTGLAVCTRLDPKSCILFEKYYDIVDEFSTQFLELPELLELRNLFPLINSRNLSEHPEDITALFG